MFQTVEKYWLIAIIALWFVPGFLALSADGTILPLQKYAWSENMGWVNFATQHGNVRVTDAALSGYVWNANYGWINLAPSGGGVKNDGAGNLSGYAWGQNTGWINFDGVSIDEEGIFSGTAIGVVSGRITFDCDRCGVQTDWRPLGDIPGEEVGRGSSGYLRHRPASSTAPGQAVELKLYPEPQHPAIRQALETELARTIKKALAILIPDFIQARLYSGIQLDVPLRDLVPKQATAPLRGRWELIPFTAVRFALQPLPTETRLLAKRLPALGQMFEKVGVSRMADVSRLRSAKIALPNFSRMIGLNRTKVVPGKFALTVGIPVAELPVEAKKRLPYEVIFARTFGERIDLRTDLTFNNKGAPIQRIAVIAGKTLNLVVKPEAAVRSVKGYIVLSKPEKNRASAIRLPMNSLVAGAMFAAPKLALRQAEPIRKESKLVLAEFEYFDSDKDGIYTAHLVAPVVAGDYEVITVMDYMSSELGPKEIRLAAVVDPEGYVFTQSGKFEARVSGATISLFWKNPMNDEFELWPAKEYLQENPQTTDERGTYSFLVPEGEYYLEAVADGFKPYRGESFTVEEGNGVHTNLELVSGAGWRQQFDWKLGVILAAALALLYRWLKKIFRTK